MSQAPDTQRMNTDLPGAPRRGNPRGKPRHPLSAAWGLAMMGAALGGMAFLGTQNYTVFHSWVELFSVAVAIALFMIAWNVRRRMGNDFLLFVAIAYAAVGLLDLVHALAYEGMGAFRGITIDEPTQLWIAARYLQALCLLAAPLWLTRRLPVAAALAALGLLDAFLLASILQLWAWVPRFPACHLGAPRGQTAFKVDSEYLISALLLVAILLLWLRRRRLDRAVFAYVAAAMVVTMASEIAFTSYVNVTETSNMVGHLLKVVAVYLTYRALVAGGLQRPFDVLFRERKADEQALRRSADELARSNKELEQFGYIVSHDLQEPLRAVTGFLQLLDQQCGKELGDKGRQYAAFAIDGAKRMSRMIHDLLEYSRVQTQARPLAPTDLKDAFEQARANCAAGIAEAQAQVTCGDLPTVLGDSTQLVRLFQNLLGNAVKFRRPDVRPEIQVSARTHDGGWRFQVRDNGIGIPPDQADGLFQLFRRLHGRDQYPGTGIGLATCKKIVERHGGRIWIESQPGPGTTFCFTLG